MTQYYQKSNHQDPNSITPKLLSSYLIPIAIANITTANTKKGNMPAILLLIIKF
jgi:hypothetical protein